MKSRAAAENRLEAQVAALADIEDHVSAEAIAKKMGCSARSVRDDLVKGNFPRLMIGRRYFFPVVAVEAYIQSRLVGNHPARKPTPVTPIFDRPRRTATH